MQYFRAAWMLAVRCSASTEKFAPEIFHYVTGEAGQDYVSTFFRASQRVS